MDKAKRARLEAAGWAVSTPKAFLGLSDDEAVLIEVKVALAAALKAQRVERAMSQVEAAKHLAVSSSKCNRLGWV